MYLNYHVCDRTHTPLCKQTTLACRLTEKKERDLHEVFLSFVFLRSLSLSPSLSCVILRQLVQCLPAYLRSALSSCHQNQGSYPLLFIVREIFSLIEAIQRLDFCPVCLYDEFQ